MKPQIRHAVTAVILLLWSATFAMAASVSVTPPSGSGKFTIQGEGMDGVAGFDLVISYDGTLSSPTVTQGSLISGAMMAANTNIPNSIKIAVVSTKSFSGSGPIAIITFGRGSGNVRAASANMINSSGASISASTTTATTSSGTQDKSTGTQDKTTDTQQSSGTLTSTTTTTPTPPDSSTPATLGAVNIAPDAFLKDEAKAAETADSSVATSADAPATVADATPAEQTETAKLEDPKKSEEIKFISYSGVLERFRTYQGEKTPKILAALIKKEISPNIHQEPPVALSDGKTNVTIIATLSSTDGKSPNFALNGAKLVSLKKEEDSNKWIVETLPAVKSLKVGLTIQNGNEVIEFPLTVAPVLSDIDASETGFVSYLKNKTADLNKDGKHDHIDDFIFTANYLVQMDKSKPAEKTKPAGKAKP